MIENVATYTQRHPHAFTLLTTVIFSSLGDDENYIRKVVIDDTSSLIYYVLDHREWPEL